MPLGVIISIPIHPTLVEYILFRKVVVYLFWGTNLMLAMIVTMGVYLGIRLLVPQLFEWANLGVRYRFRPHILSQRKR